MHWGAQIFQRSCVCISQCLRWSGSHPLSLCRCICHVLCQLCMMTPIGVFEQLRWESEIQPQGLRSTAWWSLRIGIADATSKMVEKRGYPGIMISPTFCFVVPTSLIFFSHPKDWNDSPITSCSGSTTQSFIASACPSVRCVAWGRSHDDENWSIRDLRWEEKTLPQGLRADAFMTWCLTQCVVSLKWPMAGPVPFTVTFPCHGFCPTPRLEMRLYTKGLRGGNGPRT